MEYDPATGEILWREQVHISDHFTDVLKKMLEVSVRHRYQNATEVLRALDLEPYLDSLARSMVSQPNRSRSGLPYSGELGELSSPSSSSSPSSPPSSPSARMAAAIRARQASKSLISGPLQSEATTIQPGSPRRRTIVQAANSLTEINSRSSGGNPISGIPKPSADDLLAAYAKGRRDFSSHDLSLLNLAKTDLSGANFHEAKLHKINLQGANLLNSDFGRASLSQASLKNAKLARAYLSHADLAGADLRGADLSYAYLSHANLRGANLCGADLTGAKVTDEQLSTARTNWATIHPSGKRGLW
jgi:serine/threonine-protein kinase